MRRLPAKFACTDTALPTVNVHFVDVPLHPPVQPLKFEPFAGVAVSVRIVPPMNDAVHAPPQLIPAGELATVPLPFPPFVTLTV